jgi:hypothetical protein
MQTWDTPHDKIMASIAAFGEHIIPGLGGSSAPAGAPAGS